MPVYCYYQGDGRHLITNSKDQTIKLWDMRKFSDEEGISVSLDAFLKINVGLNIFFSSKHLKYQSTVLESKFVTGQCVDIVGVLAVMTS